jgi:tetratricopeptide (TPR) repeat protein
MKLKKLTKPLLIGLLVLIIIITQPLLTVALTSTQIYDIAEKITVRIGGANNGSGVIINKISNIYTVLSNAHVFNKNKGQYRVYTYDRRDYSITNIKKAPNSIDLAIFEFTSSIEYPVAQPGDSEQIRGGKPVFVSGYPQGKTDMNFLDSIITRVDRQLKKGYTLVYRIGAYPGMSGGPVLDEQGKLIGIHGESQDIYGGAGLEPTPINREEYGIPIKTYQTWASQLQKTALEYYRKGNARYDLGDYQGAIDDYNQALKLDPNNAKAYYNRGIARSDLGDNQGAIDDYTQAIKLDPNNAYAYNTNNAYAYNNRGFARYNLGDKQGAIDDYTQAIKLDPNNAYAYNNRGFARYNLGDNQGAMDDLQKAAELRISTGFRTLESLLKAQDFRAADQVTNKIMLAVANRENQGWLRKEDAANFPCKELRSIDQLWLKYSRGKFGISVQQQIYQSLGGTKEYNLDVWRSMADRVEWRRNDNWLFYSDLNFSQTALSGHLPTSVRWGEGGACLLTCEDGHFSHFPPVQTCRV